LPPGRQSRRLRGHARTHLLAGADLLFDPRWLPRPRRQAVQNLRDPVQAGIDWEVHRLKLFGREVDSPRLSRWIGDPGTSYRYSGVRFEPPPGRAR
jgi:alkylated DNA repair dioxygenase AlkB